MRRETRHAQARGQQPTNRSSKDMREREGRGVCGSGARGGVLSRTSRSMVTASSGLSTFDVCRIIVFPEPRSPLTENFTPSLVTEIFTVSPTICRSRVMRWNSEAGILMVAV